MAITIGCLALPDADLRAEVLIRYSQHQIFLKFHVKLPIKNCDTIPKTLECKMTSAIGSATKVPYTPPVQTSVPQAQIKDSDGDNDGSKVGAIDKPKATSGTVGTIINTQA